MKPHALVTNDDGIESAFLHRLVASLLPEFRISVAAPAFEQSWIGRAMSRREEIEVVHSPATFEGTEEAWAISGTPTDCVNIALGHLLPEKPDVVVSGINIGYNTTEALMLSSGTIAGALEGAFWGLPAIAFSQCVPKDLFPEVSRSKGRTSGDFSRSLDSAARWAALMSREVLDAPPPAGVVLNINFPPETGDDSSILETRPAKVELGSMFKEVRPGRFRFHFHEGLTVEKESDTDRAALDAGYISRSILDFSKIGRGHSEHE
ncbi:5'/3'-nucleotidase SurE [Coraliomargarita sinensis]|uniref:5'-nucleotidase n=1 Tax=Coraliomargarita sinensis TaxID=2174842 RepID=A0A317ZNI7_9BACT|nr:5'/3'-nucleotidase SurE [Coraliomargarita sinensis]PXA05438.1 5'/3'-nucleotidase SurE [Coraliomargarita sinensis]